MRDQAAKSKFPLGERRGHWYSFMLRCRLFMAKPFLKEVKEGLGRQEKGLRDNPGRHTYFFPPWRAGESLNTVPTLGTPWILADCGLKPGESWCGLVMNSSSLPAPFRLHPCSFLYFTCVCVCVCVCVLVNQSWWCLADSWQFYGL